MGPSVKLLLLLIIAATCHLGFGDKAYKVIKFKVPQTIWRQALQPTPVLRSPVTITVPINVHDEDVEDDDNEIEDAVEDEIENEVAPVADAVVETANVTQALQDPVPVVSTAAPVAPQNPVLQEGEVSPQPEQGVPGQVFRFPCECRSRQCGCCTGALMDRIRMKACGNISFIPEDFVFDVRMSINNNTVVRRRVSASDPPPICFNPRRAPFVRVCVEISNIQIRNRNAHACLDINADIGGFPVYSASFRCFRLGSSGVQTGLKPRPVSSGPKPVSLFGNSNNDDDDGGGGGGFLENAAGNVFGGDGIFGGGGSSDDGPFDGIGDAFGGLFDGDS